MGPVLEMRHRWALAGLAALPFVLAGCSTGKSPSALPIKAILQAELARLKGESRPAGGLVAQPDPAILAEGRRVLQEAGQPVISVVDPTIGLVTFMAPLGENAGVVTWANPEYQTISMREGVILATRGFGADLMSAEVPSAATLSLGKGTYQRVHYVLDGGDQTQKQVYSCRLSVSNKETISVLGLNYDTKKVDEVCTGDTGSLTNSYWFDHNGVIRQSRQAKMAGVENMQLQAIID
jgi:hypothetical protein